MGLFSSHRRKGGGQLVQKVQQQEVTSRTNSAAQPAPTLEGFLSSRLEEASTRSLPSAVREHLPQRITASSATYAALQPCADASILEVVTSGARPHVFAATMTSEPTAHGGDYLRRNLHKELVSQVIALKGDVPSAFKQTFAHLDLKFRALHVYNSHALDGTQFAAAFVDLTAGKAYLASNGGCRAVIATRDELGRSEVTVDVGRLKADDGSSTSAPASQQQQQQQQIRSGAGLHNSGGRLSDDDIATVQLSGNIDSIIMGSSGLWHEVPSHQAALRVAASSTIAPHAMGGNTAAQLAQLALQNVARRVSTSKDPRMSALQDAATLQQLWVGSKRNYKWGKRQPLRRRRGDVHGDLSAVVIRFDWTGTTSLPRSSFVCKKMCALQAAGTTVALPRSASGTSIASVKSFGSLRAAGRASHWDAVRAHFLHFRPAASAAARARWYATVDAALAASRATQVAATAAAAVSEPAVEAVMPQQPQPQPISPVMAAPPAAKSPVSPRAIAVHADAAEIAAAAFKAAMPVAPRISAVQQQLAAQAAAAEEQASLRQVLRTTSYRRLTPTSRLNLIKEFDTPPLQELSAY